jgi:hypothetical protein
MSVSKAFRPGPRVRDLLHARDRKSTRAEMSASIASVTITSDWPSKCRPMVSRARWVCSAALMAADGRRSGSIFREVEVRSEDAVGH